MALVGANRRFAPTILYLIPNPCALAVVPDRAYLPQKLYGVNNGSYTSQEGWPPCHCEKVGQEYSLWAGAHLRHLQQHHHLPDGPVRERGVVVERRNRRVQGQPQEHALCRASRRS